MGLMRINQNINDILPGQFVIWEYSLLDEILAPFYPEAVVFSAMLQAWHLIMSKGAFVVVVMTPPRESILPSRLETRIYSKAISLGIPVLNLRDLLGTGETFDDHYRDDRHPNEKGILPSRTAQRLVELFSTYDPMPGEQNCPEFGKPYRWIGVDELRQANGKETNYENSLVKVSAARFDPGQAFCMGGHHNVIAVGIVAHSESGALWCGHAPCAPASCVPSPNGYPFLLQSTRLPCVHESIDRIVCRPDYWPITSWSDYGNISSDGASPIDVFGILVEEASK